MIIRINLIPVEKTGPKRAYTQLALMVVMLVAAMVIIGYLWMNQKQMIENKNNEIAEKRKRVQALQETIQRVREFEQKRDMIKQKLKIIADSKEFQKLPVMILMDMLEVIPDQIWLTQFTSAGGGFTGTGYSLSFNGIGNFIESIEAAPYFRDPKLGSAVRTVYAGREVIFFNFTFGFVIPES
jgi:type IV pilus assembly protein PilN